MDGTEPNEESSEYTGPVKVTGKEIRLKTFATNGRASRTSTLTSDELMN